MATKGKKRKLDEEAVISPQERFVACTRSLLVAASLDPAGWCQIGNVGPDGCIKVLNAKEMQQTYPLTEALPSALIFVGTQLADAKRRATETKGRAVHLLSLTDAVVLPNGDVVMCAFPFCTYNEGEFQALLKGDRKFKFEGTPKVHLL